MAHDFAKKRAPSSPRSRAAPPRSTHWLWFFSGLVVGVLGCALVFLAVGGPAQPKVASSTDASAKPAVSAKKATPKPPPKPEKAAASAGNTQFTFYTLLPESEVIVGDEAEAPATPSTTAPAASKPEPATPDVPKLSLQAGSFQQLGDADRRRAQVILLGFDASIESVNNGGQRWHRVHVGPFKDATTLARAQRTLKDVGIDTIKVSRAGG